jgi:pheromone a factor receptor
MSSTPGLSRGRYIRLMAISAVEILGTIPLGTLYIVQISKLGVTPWRGWAHTHKNYSEVNQVPASIWKNEPDSVFFLEMYRWSLVLCAFLFFALFGFANEARQNYRRLYTSIASRIGYSTCNLLRPSNACVFYSLLVFGLDSLGLISFFSTSSTPYVKSNGGVTVSVVTTSGDKRRSSVSFSDQSLTQSISVDDDPKPDLKDKYSPSKTVMSSSVERFHEPKSAAKQDQSALPAGTMPTAPSATVPPHLPGMTKSTFRSYSDFNEV